MTLDHSGICDHDSDLVLRPSLSDPKTVPNEPQVKKKFGHMLSKVIEITI